MIACLYFFEISALMLKINKIVNNVQIIDMSWVLYLMETRALLFLLICSISWLEAVIKSLMNVT